MSTGLSKQELEQPRVCRECGRTKMLVQFVVLDRATMRFSTQCKDCERQSDRKKLAEAKKEAAKEGLRGLAAQVRQTKLDVPHISEYLEFVLRRIGGPEILASMHVDQIEMLCMLRPGTSGTVRAIGDVVKLILASTEHRATAPDLAQITDAELNQLLAGLISQRLTENPTFLEDAALQMGFQLVPMANVIDEVPAAPELPAPVEEDGYAQGS